MAGNLKIVLIEDDADDVELLQEALDTNGVSYSIIILKDGSAAISYFQQAREMPDIIVMDFNLPRVHGREVIRQIRLNAKFAKTPILILSTSSAKEDIGYAYNVGANKYLVKPATLEAIQETVSTIVHMANRQAATA